MGKKRTTDENLDLLSDYVGDIDSLYDNENEEQRIYKNKRLDRILRIRNFFMFLIVFVILVFAVGMWRTLSYGKNGNNSYFLITEEYETMVEYDNYVSGKNGDGTSLYTFVRTFGDSSSEKSIYTITQNANKYQTYATYLESLSADKEKLTSYNTKLKNQKEIVAFNKKLIAQINLIQQVLEKETNRQATDLDDDGNGIIDTNDAILDQIVKNNNEEATGLVALYAKMSKKIKNYNG